MRLTIQAARMTGWASFRGCSVAAANLGRRPRALESAVPAASLHCYAGAPTSVGLAVSVQLNVLFPLPLTLSPKEKESTRPVCERSPKGEPLARAPKGAPSPRGEGWGEEERASRLDGYGLALMGLGQGADG